MQITNRIHLLKHPFKVMVGPDTSLDRFVYSLVVFDETITLIDCGTKESLPLIVNAIEENQRDPEEINTVILSHAHPDHMGCAAMLKKQYGCKVISHSREVPWIENIEQQILERPVPGFKLLTEESVKVDETVEDGQCIAAGKNISLQVMLSPGHSCGQIALLFKEDRILFTADAVPLPSDIPNYDNFGAAMATLQRIKGLTEYDTLLSSWADPLDNRAAIQQFIEASEHYLTRIDTAVQENYGTFETAPLENCSKVIAALGLPPLFVNPVVDRAFRSHLPGERETRPGSFPQC